MGKKGKKKTSKNNVTTSKSNDAVKSTPQAAPISTPYLTEDETISGRPPPNQGLNGSMSSSSKMKFPPSLAAAMLSFPWPPPEKSKMALARLKEDKSKVSSGGEDPNGNVSKIEVKGAGKVANESLKAKASNSRKFYRKKSCCCCSTGKKEERNVVINGDPHRKPGEPFLPVTVPPFTHVHTAWPGFDHAPVPNWKNKYLIAKPYPYHQRKWEQTLAMKANANDINSNAVFSRPSELDILDRTWRNQTGRSLASEGGQTSSTRMSRMNKFDGLTTSDDEKGCVCSTATTTLHKRSVVRSGGAGGCCRRK